MPGHLVVCDKDLSAATIETCASDPLCSILAILAHSGHVTHSMPTWHFSCMHYLKTTISRHSFSTRLSMPCSVPLYLSFLPANPEASSLRQLACTRRALQAAQSLLKWMPLTAASQSFKMSPTYQASHAPCVQTQNTGWGK